MADTTMTLFAYRCIQTNRQWWQAQQWHSLFTDAYKLTQQWHSSFKDENKLIDDDGWHSNDTLCLQM